jgi:uncharacterized protein YbjQ (UPF0145 family)
MATEGTSADVPHLPSLPVTTGLDFPGWKVVRSIGPCFGLIVRSMGAVKSMGAGFRGMRQGEVPQYTELLEQTRRHAVDRMVDEARRMGGNAIIMMRFDSSGIGGYTEIVAYGTAVVVTAP